MTKRNGHQTPNQAEGAGFADGRLESAPGLDDSEFIATLQARFDLDYDKAVEIYTEVWEHVGATVPQRRESNGADSALEKTFRRGILVCASGRSYQQIAFMFGCLAVEIGMGEYWGVTTAAQLAKLFGLTKADATNYVTRFRAGLKEGAGELPPINGQRTAEQRQGFRAKRNAQEESRRRKMLTATSLNGLTVKGNAP